MTKTLMGRLIVIIFVILSYLLLTLTSSNFSSSLKREPTTPYSYLTEGFLHGQLSLSILPPPEILNIKDILDLIGNPHILSDDVSLFEGKYYLYFGPLPILFFFLPFKLLTGLYPPDPFAIFFFLSLGFIVGFSLLIKIKETHFPTIAEGQLLFAGLLLGFANNSPFLFFETKFFESAIASAFCLMNLTLYFLYASLHQYYASKHLPANHPIKLKNLFFFSLCLGLTVAGRPHCAFICILLVPAVLLWLLRYTPTHMWRTLFFILLLPISVVAISLGLYNYLRFHSVFEFGFNYQLWVFHLMKRALPQVVAVYHHNSYITHQLYYYFLQPLSALHTLPLLPTVNGMSYSATVGILRTTPFIVFCVWLPFFLYSYAKHKVNTWHPLLWLALFMLLDTLVILLFLISVPYTAQRYQTDFAPYLVMLAIISFWFLQKSALHPLIVKITKFLFIITGIMSIYTGIELAAKFTLILPFNTFTLLIKNFSIYFHYHGTSSIILFTSKPLVIALTYLLARVIQDVVKIKKAA